MNDFSFLKQYLVDPKQDDKSQKHSLYPVEPANILKAEEKIGELPGELYEFYREIGYGFFHNSERYEIDRFMSPMQVAKINLKEDFYQNDPDLELYDDLYNGEKLLFFEVNEGIYLAIDKVNKKGKNAVYYMGDKIADSLQDFLKTFDGNKNLIEEIANSSSR